MVIVLPSIAVIVLPEPPSFMFSGADPKPLFGSSLGSGTT
jgi:hypothetical protein